MECCKEECSVKYVSIHFFREPVLSYLHTLDKENHIPKKGPEKSPKKSNCEVEQNNAQICLVVYSSIIQCLSQNLDPIEYMKQ